MLISKKLIDKYGNQSHNYFKIITKMCDSYHNSSIALLQHLISYHEKGQYLKRFYQGSQFGNKIQMLSDFYKYHRQIPCVFHQDLHSIIQNYHEDWRILENNFVSKKMKQGQTDQLAFTNREKTNRVVEKVLKNIQLSYNNFQNKNDKKIKANENQKKNKPTLMTRNKKSIPLLPLYQFHKQNNIKKKSKIQTIKVLGVKDMNLNSKKSKQKHGSKKISANNSIEEPKNLSRTKSKSNLVTAFALQHNKRNSVKVSQNEPVARNDKMKSTQASLKKTQSTKNILERKKSEIKTKVIKLDQKRQEGVNYMFKRLSQARNTLKTGR